MSKIWMKYFLEARYL